MKLKVFRRRLLAVYLLIIMTLFIYAVGKTYTYKLLLNKNDLIQQASAKQATLEEANMKINSLISRDAIANEYPDLKLYSNNVFYLEKIDETDN